MSLQTLLYSYYTYPVSSEETKCAITKALLHWSVITVFSLSELSGTRPPSKEHSESQSGINPRINPGITDLVHPSWLVSHINQTVHQELFLRPLFSLKQTK